MRAANDAQPLVRRYIKLLTNGVLLLLVPSVSRVADEKELEFSSGPAELADDMDADLAEAAELESLQLSQEPLYHDQDLLTCGECRCEFALADILKFIRHKVKECRSRCAEATFGNGDEARDSDEATELKALDADGPLENSDGEVRKQTPSIISQRHKLKLQQAKALQLVSTQQRLRHAQLSRRIVQTVDAYTNTINTGN